MAIKGTFAGALALALSALSGPDGAAAQEPSYASNGDPALATLIAEALRGQPRASWGRSRRPGPRAPGSLEPPRCPIRCSASPSTCAVPETRVGPQTSAVSLSQAFPWFGTPVGPQKHRGGRGRRP